MKICLIRPPRFMVLSAIALRPAAPLGLAFIAGSLRTAGHEVYLIDGIGDAPDQIVQLNESYVLNGLSHEQIVERILPDTDAIGFSCMFSMNWIQDRALIDKVGQRYPDTLLFAGGEHINAAAEFSLKQARHLDICVLGEGEETAVEVIKAFETDQDYSVVSGIAYRNSDGNLAVNTKRTRIREIENIPQPAWDLFPLESYHENKMVFGVVKSRTLPLLASRGCPYTCTFCSSPGMWGTKYSIRSPKHVADEIEYFHTKYGIDNFDFFDLTAVIKKGWVIEFSQEILGRGLNITWQLPAGTRSEAIDAECAKHLYISGCRHISYAPESGSNEILRKIKKKISLDKMLTSMRYAYQEKLHIKLNMIFGFPDETHKDVWLTMWFLVKCSWIGVHEIGPSSFQPYPGSELFDRLVKEGKLNMEDDNYFYEMVKTDDFFQNSFYNDHMSIRWLQFYQVLAIIIFYASNFLFRPIRFFELVKGLVTKNYNSKLEMAIGELLSRGKFRYKQFQNASVQ